MGIDSQFSLEKSLGGGDLHSKGASDEIAERIKDQEEFDHLFSFLHHNDKLVAMRAADALEKVTRKIPEFLSKHKDTVLAYCQKATNKDVLWHLAALVPRLILREPELAQAWDMLTVWARDKQNSRIVRVMSVQALFDLLTKKPELYQDFKLLLEDLEREQVPSLKARIRLIRKELSKRGLI